MSELPAAAVERLIRNAGAPRVSATAVTELTNILEARATEISTQAAALAKHAGRKTVTSDDIKMALR